MTKDFDKFFLRILDANTNRLKEGLRVIEDIARFVKEDKKIMGEIKKARHDIDFYIKSISPDYKKQINFRESKRDIGKKKYTESEFKRKNLQEILVSNFKRVQEALRVLEEISKVKDIKVAVKFKQLRFKIYSMEKFLYLNHNQLIYCNPSIKKYNIRKKSRSK